MRLISIWSENFQEIGRSGMCLRLKVLANSLTSGLLTTLAGGKSHKASARNLERRGCTNNPQEISTLLKRARI